MNEANTPAAPGHFPCNKGKLVGQKPPLKLREIWAIRTRLQVAGRTREIALFNLAIDSKLRGCYLVRLRVRDVAHGAHVLSRASVEQQKTQQPVRFELTEQTREAVAAWIAEAKLSAGDYLFPSRQHQSLHLSTRQYARIVKRVDQPAWRRSTGVRDTLASPHQGDPDLSPDEEPAGRTVAARASEASVDGALSGN